MKLKIYKEIYCFLVKFSNSLREITDAIEEVAESLFSVIDK